MKVKIYLIDQILLRIILQKVWNISFLSLSQKCCFFQVDSAKNRSYSDYQNQMEKRDDQRVSS